jgi:glycosyltransferase involved in cell wall biosynthesis
LIKNFKLEIKNSFSYLGNWNLDPWSLFPIIPSQMKILYLVPRYSPAVGGSENLIKFFAEKMAKEGHEVTVYTSNVLDVTGLWAWEKKRRIIEKDYEVINGVHVHRFPIQTEWLFGSFFLTKAFRKILQYVPFWQIQCLRGNIFSPRLYKKAFSSKEKFDVVHVTPVPFDSLFYCGYKIAKNTGAKLICTPAVHLDDSVVKEYTRSYTLKVLEKYDLLLTNTDIETDFLKSRLQNQNIQTLGLGIRPDDSNKGNREKFRKKYHIPLDGVVLFYVGTKCQDKGTFELVKAFLEIYNKNKDIYLILAGNEFPDFTQYMSKVNNPNIIYFNGPIDEKLKWDIFAAGDIFVMTSRTDSFGIVYLEAWANKKPVIGADSGGVPGVIDNTKNGFLVPFGDIPALRDKINYLIMQPDERNALGEKGYNKLQNNFTEEIIFNKIIKFYEKKT